MQNGYRIILGLRRSVVRNVGPMSVGMPQLDMTLSHNMLPPKNKYFVTTFIGPKKTLLVFPQTCRKKIRVGRSENLLIFCLIFVC